MLSVEVKTICSQKYTWSDIRKRTYYLLTLSDRETNNYPMKRESQDGLGYQSGIPQETYKADNYTHICVCICMIYVHVYIYIYMYVYICVCVYMFRK